MATLGLKRQGKLWALLQGTEMIGSPAGGGVRSAAPAEAPQEDADDVPHYDNAAEYERFLTALDEAVQHPPLDDADKQRERIVLQEELCEAAARFNVHHGRRAGDWNADAEQEFDGLLRRLNDLLKLVGLSVTAYGHLG